MKRIVLFSTFTEKNTRAILSAIFPKEIKNKILAYMPCDGADSPPRHIKRWKKYTAEYGAGFRYIDNSQKDGAPEGKKLLEANILVISGGNPFTLLRNLRRSGLDQTIHQFVRQPEFVLSGFSAGSMVLTPTIKTTTVKNRNKNLVGITDLTGLGIINFETFVHHEDKWKKAIQEYEKTSPNEVKKLADDDILVIDL